MASRKLEVQIVGDASSLQRAFGQSASSASSFGSKLAKVGKIAAVGLAAGVGVATVAAVKFAQAALDAEKSQTRLDAAFRHANASAAQRAAAMQTVSKVSTQAGLDDEDLADSLARLTQVTGNVTKAQSLMALSADVARGRGMELGAATALVTKAALGNVGALKRMGIAIPAVTTATDALRSAHGKATVEQTAAAKAADLAATKQAAIAALQKKFGGDAAAYGKTASGAMDRFKVAIENVQESLGAALLPSLSRAAGSVSDFLNKFDEAKGAGAKFRVVVDGLKSLGAQIEAALRDAVAKVDWGKVWSGAQGIAEGLRARLAAVDWKVVGAAIGTGIATGVAQGGEVAKSLASAFFDATRQIKWEKVGRGMGPGLAAAVVSAIATLLDPGFWLRNWDMMLAIALTVFGGAIGKVVGKLGTILAVNVGRAISSISPAVGREFAGVVTGLALVLPQAVARLSAKLGPLFAPLVGSVTKVFAKIGSVATFTLKVLGIQAAINTVVNFGKDIYAKLKELAGSVGGWAAAIGSAIVHGIGAGLDSAKEWLLGKAGGLVKSVKDKLEFWRSPADAYGRWIGGNLATGIGDGIANRTVYAANAGKKLVASVKSEVVNLQGELNAINARREAEDRASAVRQATVALAEARKKGQGVAEAERTLQRAIEDIQVAALQKQLDRQQQRLDREQTQLDRRKERWQKHLDDVKAAAEKAQARMVTLFDKMAGRIRDAFDLATQAWTSPSQQQSDLIQARRQAEDLQQAVVDAERDLADARVGGDVAGIAEAERRLARSREDIVLASLQRQAEAERNAWETERSNLREKLDERIGLIREKLDVEGGSWKTAMAAITELLSSWNGRFATAGGSAAAEWMAGWQAQIAAATGTTMPVAASTTQSASTSPLGSSSIRKIFGFASGGIVKATPGGILARIGEGRYDEAVVPLKPGMGGGGAVVNVTVNGWVGNDQDIAARIQQELVRYGRRNTSIFSSPGVTV